MRDWSVPIKYINYACVYTTDRISAAMENASLSSDAWHPATTASDDLTLYLANIRDLALKVIYIIIGTVGVLDNLFVLVVFLLYIKITDKVPQKLRKPIGLA